MTQLAKSAAARTRPRAWCGTPCALAAVATAGRYVVSRAALPEHIELPMPRLVPSMKHGVVSKWLIAEGEYVGVGDLVLEVDVADLVPDVAHATLLIETHEVGYLAKKLKAEGDTVAVDVAIAVFCEEVCVLACGPQSHAACIRVFERC
jgi:hypothetical protein